MATIDRILSWFSWLTEARHRQIVQATEAKMRTASAANAKAAFDDGYDKGKAEGIREGRREGRLEGRQLEQADQADRLRKAEEERVRREREEAKERAKWLVSETPIGISAAIREEIRMDVNARIKHPPEAAQWEMILADNPATYVIAGAGSGKSTSLVLRVIALNLYRGIDRRNISVFTFTRASRKDFIKKYRERMEQWGEEITEDEARCVVRTFHSMVLKMARESIRPRPRVLELLDREREGEVRDIDVENLLEARDTDLPEASSNAESEEESDDDATNSEEGTRDTRTRDNLLRIAYERAFASSPTFASLIVELYKWSLRQSRRAKDDNTEKNIGRVARNDEAMTSALDAEWRTRIAPGGWPLKGIQVELDAITVSPAVRQRFWVNGYIPQLEAYIVLGGSDFFRGTDPDDIPSEVGINTKRKLLAGISDKPIVWIDTPKQLDELRLALKWFSDYQEKRAEVPMFKLIAPSEIKRKTITEAFFGLAQFVENLGLPVTDTLKSVVPTEENKIPKPDALFTRAASLFWPHFESTLEQENIWTFNQLFAHFSEERPDNLKKVPSYVLRAMQHLLIDEFQDISPQIVKWIRGCQRELVRRGMAGTLTCVGDDWQSIYGWRGSSPDYFVRFKKHFQAPHEPTKILLEDNFRSSDHILRCAESVLAGVPDMEPKTCRAKGVWAAEPTPVMVHIAKGKLPYDEIALLAASEAQRTGATEEEPMLVLARSAKAHRSLSNMKRPPWGKTVKFMTFHAAKGLESRSVVLLEDCVYSGTNPLRNFLYQTAGLGSYDEAQRSEARRLAYVAMTRAMERCYWFANKKEDGAIESIPMGRAFVKKIDSAGKALVSS